MEPNNLLRRRPGRPKDPQLEARRREQILEAAVLLFAQNGYAETDLQVVADHLQVGKGTLYRYFPSKRELFLAAVDQGLKGLSNRINQDLSTEADGLVRFARGIHTYLAFFDEHPQYVELFIQERAAFRDRRVPTYFAVRSLHEEFRVAFVRSLVETGRFRPMAAEQIVDVVSDLLYGTVVTNYLTGRRVPVQTQAGHILDIVFHGILSDAERQKLPPCNSTAILDDGCSKAG